MFETFFVIIVPPSPPLVVNEMTDRRYEWKWLMSSQRDEITKIVYSMCLCVHTWNAPAYICTCVIYVCNFNSTLCNHNKLAGEKGKVAECIHSKEETREK